MVGTKQWTEKGGRHREGGPGEDGGQKKVVAQGRWWAQGGGGQREVMGRGRW